MTGQKTTEVRKTDIEYIDEKLIESAYLFCYKRLNNSQDAEDLTQEIFLEAVKAIRAGKKIEYFYPWFWQLARNRLNTFLRMKKYHAVELDFSEELLKDEGNIEDALIKSEEISALNYSISRLSRLNREVIILYYLKEMKVSEIAAALDIPSDYKRSSKGICIYINRDSRCTE